MVSEVAKELNQRRWRPSMGPQLFLPGVREEALVLEVNKTSRRRQARGPQRVWCDATADELEAADLARFENERPNRARHWPRRTRRRARGLLLWPRTGASLLWLPKAAPTIPNGWCAKSMMRISKRPSLWFGQGVDNVDQDCEVPAHEGPEAMDTARNHCREGRDRRREKATARMPRVATAVGSRVSRVSSPIAVAASPTSRPSSKVPKCAIPRASTMKALQEATPSSLGVLAVGDGRLSKAYVGWVQFRPREAQHVYGQPAQRTPTSPPSGSLDRETGVAAADRRRDTFAVCY